MANFKIDSLWGWSYDGSNLWNFYKNDSYYQFNAQDEFYFNSGYRYFSLVGEKLTYKADGTNSNGETQYLLTGGTVTGFVYDNRSNHTYISDTSVSAAKLSGLMLDGSPAASAKIFAAILAGDDDVVLGMGSDRFRAFGGTM
jgi:hypothetical protein